MIICDKSHLVERDINSNINSNIIPSINVALP